MRALPALLLVLVAASAAAEMPRHLAGLPGGIVHRGPAPAALGAAGEGGRARLWLPGGERTFEVERVVAAAAATTRFGRVHGVGQAAITLGPDGGFGRVTQGATVWLLEYRGGAAFAVRAGEGGLPFAPYDDGALTPTGATARPKGAPGGAWQSGARAHTVDFAGLYDADFAARYPGSLAATRIEHFVALANQAFVDSNVGITLRTIHTRQAPGAAAPSALDNIEAMLAAATGGSFAGVDLRALRARYGADIVSFFRAQDLYAREVCGVAFFPLDLRTGANVVMDGESGGSICDDYTFAHEVGHNFGARHQLGADSMPSQPGHAFVRPGRLTTIMATFGTGRPDRHRTLGYFSNPRIACGNLPCGAAAAEDNAAVMSANAALVARYLASRSLGAAPRPGPLLADSDGDGVIDRIDAFPFDAARTSDRDGDGVADADDAFPDNSTEWRDTDGGGLGDNADGDDDNDGVPDASDRFPLDPLEWADADNDGWGDNADAFDADPREQRDTDGDGLGDRADDDDDGDGTVDVAPLATPADGELLVADGATDRILRFRGSDYAPLGTLVQLGADEITFRSGIAGAPSGEVYFIAASQLRMLDRLRSATPELMLDPASHPLVGTGFPLSPAVLDSGDVALGEMGRGALLTLRPAPSGAAVPVLRRVLFGNNSAPHVGRHPFGDLAVLDGALGWLTVYRYTGDPVATAPITLFSDFSAVPALSSGDVAYDNQVYWVDRRDGAVRSFDPVAGAPGSLTITSAAATAITFSHDGRFFVAQRGGGVRLYDAGSGADFGPVIPAVLAAEPLDLAWVPAIADSDLPPIVPPAPPAPAVDPAMTPAVDSVRPPPPPCTTDCVTAGENVVGGGAFAAGLALALALLARRRLK